MKTKGTPAYTYLIIVLLLAITLSSFITPLLEGFKEGAETQTSTNKLGSGQSCNVNSDCISNNCYTKKDPFGRPQYRRCT